MASANSTADRAIEILMMFEDAHPVITASEVAERFGMPRSTTYRYLSSLRSQGLLIEAEDGGFRLGHRIFTLARIARLGFSILQVAKPHLEALLKDTGETVLLLQRNGVEISILECLESSSAIRISYARGRVLPTPASASSKVFMAFDDPAQTEKLLKKRKITPYTPHTLTDPDQIVDALAEVRRNGFAVNFNEVDEGVAAVSAPIFGTDGRVEYAVSVVAPSFRVDEARLATLAAKVKQAAAAISAANVSGY